MCGHRSDVLITNQFLDIDHPFIVRMALRETPAAQLPDLTAGFVIGKPWYSPYVAASIAGLLGADPIGLIGVDFSDDHFFGATGPYPGIKNLPVVDTQFRRLGAVLTEAGGRIANLSQRAGPLHSRSWRSPTSIGCLPSLPNAISGGGAPGRLRRPGRRRSRRPDRPMHLGGERQLVPATSTGHRASIHSAGPTWTGRVIQLPSKPSSSRRMSC